MPKIEIDWQGKSYTIKEDEAFEVAERIEDIMPLSELSRPERLNTRRLARCFAEMINFAGGRVTGAEVHAEFMAGLKDATKQDKENVLAEAVLTLVAVLMDGMPEIEGDSGGEKKGNASSKAAT